ncbi:MAG: diguanylate cyclase [Chthoniobacterales bacterium]|nr:diguanylate cyclase [Chthoniobacterales bacterium]
MNHASQPASALEAKARITEALEKAWVRGSAESSPLTVAVVSFDTPETQVGVQILQRALQVHCARSRDIVLRRSSDEFVAILPDTPPPGARRVGEQIVEAMRAADDNHTHRVSVGLAVAVPDEHRAAADLMRRAESALQAARNNGGDRCVGGIAAGTNTAPAPKGLIDRLRELFPKKEDPERKRRTD